MSEGGGGSFASTRSRRQGGATAAVRRARRFGRDGGDEILRPACAKSTPVAAAVTGKCTAVDYFQTITPPESLAPFPKSFHHRRA